MNGQGNVIGAGMLRSGLVALLAAALFVWLGAPVAAQTDCGCTPVAAIDSGTWHSVRPQTAQPATYTHVGNALGAAASSDCVWRPSSAGACGPMDQGVEVTAWRPVSYLGAYSSAPVVPATWGCAVPVSSSGTCWLGTPYYAGASCYSNAALRPATCSLADTGASACRPAFPYQNVVHRPAVPRFVLPGGSWTNRPLIVKPKVYVPGQPLRNMLRAILP